MTPTSISPVLEELRCTDLAASPAKASAIGGFIRLLSLQDNSGEDQLKHLSSKVCNEVTAHLSKAADEVQEEQWLRTLYHLIDDEDYQFCDVLDDAEFEHLYAKREKYRDRWNAEVSTILTEDAAHPWSTLPLQERLHRLQWFYSSDVNLVSKGDDSVAQASFAKARRCFEQCREELFSPDPSLSPAAAGFSLFTLHFALYYAVLCLIYPGKHNMAHIAYYKQFFNALSDCPPTTEEALWQEREVRLHYRQAPMHRADRYVMPEVAIIDDQCCKAYRMKCYQYWAGLDPDGYGTNDDFAEQQTVMNRANHLIRSWLKTKRANNIAIPVEKETVALLTCLASANNTFFDADFEDAVLHRAYELLPQLPLGSLRTSLSAHLGWYDDYQELMQQVKADVSYWPAAVDYTNPDELFVRAFVHESPHSPTPI